MVAASTLAGLVLEYGVRNRIASGLGAAGYGRVYLVIAGVAIAAKLAQAGSALGLRRFVSLHVAEGNSGLAAAYVRSCLWIVLAASLALAAAATLEGPRLAMALLGSPEQAPLIVVGAWMIPGAALLEVLQGVLLAVRRSGPAMLASPLAEKGATLLFLLVALGVAPTALRGLGATTGGVTLAAAIAFVLHGKLASGAAGLPPLRAAKDLLLFSWPIQVASLATLLMHRLDATLVGAYVPAREVGFLHAALPLAEFILLGFMALGAVTTPRLMEYVAAGDMEGLRSYYLRLQTWTLLPAGPVAALLVAFPREVLSTLYSPEFVPAAGLLRILAVAFLVTSASGPCGSVLIALGSPGRHMLATLAGVGTLLALDFALLPRLGVCAAGVARIGGFLALYGLGLAFLRRRLGPLETVSRAARTFVAVATATGCGLVAGAVLAGAPPLVRLLLGGTALLAAYAGVVFALRLVTREEWGRIARMAGLP